MARKGENIYLRKDGRWEGRYIKGRRPDGKPRFGYIYGKQYNDIKRQLVIIKAQLYKKGQLPVIYGDGTMADWADYWLEMLTRPFIKPDTYMGYRRMLDKHILPVLGKLPVGDITPAHIQDMVCDLQQQLAATTLRSVCRLLKSTLASACEKGMIMKSPYQDIRLPRIRKNPPRVLTILEQEKLEKEALSADELEYLICLYTGLRVGELCALRWKDVDLENCTLHVRHSIQRVPVENDTRKTCLIVGAPKSESSVRDIPLPYFLADMLQERKNHSLAFPNDFVFRGSKGEFRDPRTMQQRIKRICHKLDISDVHMHTLRHTFATRCLENGVRYEVLCEFLGHSSPQVTLRHYAHCTPLSKRQSMDQMECAVKI